MARVKKGRDLQKWSSNRPDAPQGKLRIIGGSLGWRLIECTGDPRTRPMKDNIREATFNLIGGWLPGLHAFDLFAGSGAIGLEALSRGCASATFIERHIPTARLIEKNINNLELRDKSNISTSDTFFWFRQFQSDQTNWPKVPWVVFCSPPYDFWVSKENEMLGLMEQMMSMAPPNSILVAESDDRFDAGKLPLPDQWRVRQYAPAQVCILRDVQEADETADEL